MELAQLVLAAGLFLGTHYLLSHPLRAALIRALGFGPFMIVYSLIATVTFSWAVFCYHRAPVGFTLWDGYGPIPWSIASVLTVVALGLFLASFAGNPAFAGAKLSGLTTTIPRGVFEITRHPMFFAIAIWAFAHILVAPTDRGLIFHGMMIVQAVGGARLQDRKKRANDGRNWTMWMRRTPFWPDVRKFGNLGMIWVVALGLWLGITWLHQPLGGQAVGIWVFDRTAQL